MSDKTALGTDYQQSREIVVSNRHINQLLNRAQLERFECFKSTGFINGNQSNLYKISADIKSKKLKGIAK